MAKIEGGFTLWARQTIDSEIFYYKPDKWFKIWFYLVSKVNHKDNRLFKRGEGLVTYEDIANKTKATKTQIEKCLKWLRREGMLDERRTTRGNIKIVSKYDTFQDIKTYQKNGETNDKTIERRIEDEQKAVPINKNDKNVKNDKNTTSELKLADKINPLIKLFEEVNPSYEKLYRNTTQRTSLKRMIKKYGEEKVTGMIKYLTILNSDKYSKGKSITPLQLEDNLGLIVAHYNQNKNINKRKITKL